MRSRAGSVNGSLILKLSPPLVTFMFIPIASKLAMAGILDGEADVMAHHGDERVDVIRVHVRRDGRAEPATGSVAPAAYSNRSPPPRARAAHEPRAQYPVHAVPREIAEVDPEGVWMLGEVRFPGGLLVRGVGDRGDGSGDGDARVRRAGERAR